MKHPWEKNENTVENPQADGSKLVVPSPHGIPPDTVEHGDIRLYAITYAIAGRARIKYNDRRDWEEISAGDSFQFNGHYQSDVQMNRDDGFVECSFCLDALTGRHLVQLDIWNTRNRVMHMGVRKDIVRAYLGYYHFISDPDASNLALLKESIQIIELLSKPDNSGADSDFRNQACRLLSENLSPAVALNTVAKRMGLSYDGFRQRFRKLVGLSPVRYRLLQRLEKAKRLLEHQSVKETAAAFGYSDPSILSRQFKKWNKQRPKDIRRTSHE